MTGFERNNERILQGQEDHFSEEIERWFSGRREADPAPIRIAITPDALQLSGMEELPIYIDVSKLGEIREKHPEITVDVLKQIPRALTDPIFVMKSKTRADRLIAALEVKDVTGVNLIIPFVLNVDRNEGRVNMAASIYGKGANGRVNYAWYVGNMLEGNLVYANMQKATNFLAPAGVQFPMAAKKGSLIDYSIKTEEDLVKFKMDKAKKMKERSDMEEDKMMKKGTEAYIDVPPPTDEDMPFDYADSYHDELSDVVASARENFTSEQGAEVQKSMNRLHEGMRDFERTERECGPDQEAWDKFAPMHEKNVQNILLASDISEAAGRDSQATQDAVMEAVSGMESSHDFIRKCAEDLRRKQTEYEAQIEGLKRRVAELEAVQKFGAGTNEDFTRAILVATQFIEQVDAMRNHAKTQPRKIASEIFKETRRQTKEAYYAVKLAPTQIKSYVVEKKDAAVDSVLGKVAGFFEKGVKKLQRIQDDILARTSGNRSAADFYKAAWREESNSGGEKDFLATEAKIAGKMAAMGMGEHTIKITLERCSPFRDALKKDGKAEKIAKEAKEKADEKKEEKKDVQEESASR